MNDLKEKMSKIFTVGELTDYIKAKLTSDKNLYNVWVKGEISNLTKHSSGHWYFTLKDKTAVLSCAMFAGENRKVQFDVKEGMKFIVLGRIDLYKPRGNYQLIAIDLKPEGIGELYLKFEALKKKLAEEGLFAKERKRPLPKFPKRIGVVTSPTGAAVRDIIHVIQRRSPMSDILLSPAKVQGEGAAKEIIDGIDLLNKFGNVDVIIIGRGGGSLEDLWPFNEEIVARAIVESKIPIISAVGHETDFTISDFVADMRAPTPSAAAEIVVPAKEQILGELEALQKRLQLVLHRNIESKHDNLEAIGRLLKPRLVFDIINQHRQKIDESSNRLVLLATSGIEQSKNKMESLTGCLNALSPLRTFSRGYSMSFKVPDRTIVDNISCVSKGDSVGIAVSDGEIQCQVVKVQEVRDWLKRKK